MKIMVMLCGHTLQYVAKYWLRKYKIVTCLMCSIEMEMDKHAIKHCKICHIRYMNE